jgi:hypothetical protein
MNALSTSVPPRWEPEGELLVWCDGGATRPSHRFLPRSPSASQDARGNRVARSRRCSLEARSGRGRCARGRLGDRSSIYPRCRTGVRAHSRVANEAGGGGPFNEAASGALEATVSSPPEGRLSASQADHRRDQCRFGDLQQNKGWRRRFGGPPTPHTIRSGSRPRRPVASGRSPAGTPATSSPFGGAATSARRSSGRAPRSPSSVRPSEPPGRGTTA